MNQYKTGFFISCFRNKEQQSYSEFIKFAASYTSKQPEEIILDITKSVENEKQNEKEQFYKINIKNLKNVVFIENKSNTCVLTLFEKLKLQKYKYIQRFIPLNTIFDLVDYKEKIQIYIDEYVNKMIDENNNDETQDNTVITYKLVIEDRLVEKETKKEIFDYTTSIMKCKVNLKNPEFVFIIQICKNKVGASFLKFDKKNFNVHMRQRKEENDF